MVGSASEARWMERAATVGPGLSLRIPRLPSKKDPMYSSQPGVRRDGVQDDEALVGGSGRHLERLEIGRVPATA